MPTSCCVPGCRSKGSRFYSFPGKPWQSELRERWIRAVRRVNPDGSLWKPSKQSAVCSAHFPGGKKSTIYGHPNSVPSIFPEKYYGKPKDEAKLVRMKERFDRFMKRRQQKPNQLDSDDKCETSEGGQSPSHSSSSSFKEEPESKEAVGELCKQEIKSDGDGAQSSDAVTEEEVIKRVKYELGVPVVAQEVPDEPVVPKKLTRHAAVQVFFFDEKTTNTQRTATFGCFRFSDRDIAVECELPIAMTRNMTCQVPESSPMRMFTGFPSVRSDLEMTALAGVHRDAFNVLCGMIHGRITNAFTNETALLMCLTKMNLNLSYTALSVIFQCTRRTAAVVCQAVLPYLSSKVGRSDQNEVSPVLPESLRKALQENSFSHFLVGDDA